MRCLAPILPVFMAALRLGMLAEDRFLKSLSMNHNDAATLANYGFLLDNIFKKP